MIHITELETLKQLSAQLEADLLATKAKCAEELEQMREQLEDVVDERDAARNERRKVQEANSALLLQLRDAEEQARRKLEPTEGGAPGREDIPRLPSHGDAASDPTASALHAELDHAHERIQELSGELSSARAQQVDFAVLLADNDSLRRSLEELEHLVESSATAETQSLGAAGGGGEGEIRALRAQLLEAMKIASESEEDCGGLRQDLRLAQQEIADLRKLAVGAALASGSTGAGSRRARPLLAA